MASPNEESVILRTILNDKSPKEFFADTWQKVPQVYRTKLSPSILTSTGTGNGNWNDEQMEESPLNEIMEQRWYVLKNLLEEAQQKQRESTPGKATEELPLVLRDLEVQQPEQVQEMYGWNLFAAYLNGCSVVVNHADLLSPWIAALCQDLQRSFPHAYANCYLTPPNSQTVPAHADDRDVLVFQLVGSKNWRVYEKVPIPHPYPYEQVGKDGMLVPNDVLEGPLSVNTTLHPGDVLYMPRGFVHEAQCSDDLSFHITVALATHDWTLAGMMSTATRNILMQIPDFRLSMLPTQGENAVASLQSDIDKALSLLRQQITAESMVNNLQARIDQHNNRAFTRRMSRVHQARFPSSTTSSSPLPIVGPEAASRLSYSSIIRAATPQERSSVVIPSDQPPGLNVREEIADEIMFLVSRIKSDPTLQCQVSELVKLLDPTVQSQPVCTLSLLCLAKRAVELGAFAVVQA